MLRELLARRVLIVLGKGGAGKTTVSAALARCAAAAGIDALVMECDVRAPMASALGVKPGFQPIEVADHISLMVLDGPHALEEYLGLVVPGRMMLKAVFASRLYQFFVQAAPGLRELMMLGKVYYESERKGAARGVIIVDAPASGQALALLKMPAAARATFGDSIVGREAHNIARMIRERRRCAIVQVATADGLSVAETIETHAELAKLKLEPAAIVFNRAQQAGFTAHDLAAFTRSRAARMPARRLEHLTELARAELNRAAQSEQAGAELRAKTGAALIEVADHPELAGRELIERIATELGETEAAGIRARAPLR